MFLETKIPPPAVTIVAAVAMWGISLFSPQLVMPSGVRLALSLAIVVVGGYETRAMGSE